MGLVLGVGTLAFKVAGTYFLANRPLVTGAYPISPTPKVCTDSGIKPPEAGKLISVEHAEDLSVVTLPQTERIEIFWKESASPFQKVDPRELAAPGLPTGETEICNFTGYRGFIARLGYDFSDKAPFFLGSPSVVVNHAYHNFGPSALSVGNDILLSFYGSITHGGTGNRDVFFDNSLDGRSKIVDLTPDPKDAEALPEDPTAIQPIDSSKPRSRLTRNDSSPAMVQVEGKSDRLLLAYSTGLYYSLANPLKEVPGLRVPSPIVQGVDGKAHYADKDIVLLETDLLGNKIRSKTISGAERQGWEITPSVVSLGGDSAIVSYASADRYERRRGCRGCGIEFVAPVRRYDVIIQSVHMADTQSDSMTFRISGEDQRESYAQPKLFKSGQNLLLAYVSNLNKDIEIRSLGIDGHPSEETISLRRLMGWQKGGRNPHLNSLDSPAWFSIKGQTYLAFFATSQDGRSRELWTIKFDLKMPSS